MIRAIIILVVLGTAAFAQPDAKRAPAQLAKDRVTACDRMFQGAANALKGGRGSVETVYAWSTRQLDAQLDAGWLLKQALADHQMRMTKLAADMITAKTSGQVNTLDADAAEYFKLEADYWVARGKR